MADRSLPTAFKALDMLGSFPLVFQTYPLINPLSPKPKTGKLQFLSHQLNYLFFLNPKLSSNSVKSGAIFPSHFDDPIYLPIAKLLQVLIHIPKDYRIVPIPPSRCKICPVIHLLSSPKRNKAAFAISSGVAMDFKGCL